jgi:ASC-1-like (ASCH) protein
MNQENLYEKIQELLGNLKGNFNILEDQIDIDVQLEYFESSKEIKKTIDSDITLDQKENLFSNKISLDNKKSLLISLASIDRVEAFRALEQYQKNPDPTLKDWATLAMQESRMLLESTFLDQNQVFISTGLGGRGQKLRYFIVFLVKESMQLDALRKKVIHSEMEFIFKKFNAEIEDIKYSESFSTVKAIIPIQVHLNEMFEEAIENCNQFGDFLQMNFIVTNLKELTFDEIKQVLQTSKFPEDTEPEQFL